MPSQYSNLKIELMETGQNNNQWGNITNTNLGTALEQAIVGMATIETGDFTTNVATLTLSNTNALQDARALCLNVTATLTGAGTINVPAIEKPYVIFNNTSGGYAITVKVSGQPGVSVPNGKKTVVYNNGTDVGEQINYLTSLSLGSALPVASGGTGVTSPGTAGNVLTSNGTAWVSSPPAVSGTVTSVSVVSANGLAGTVADASSTPAITLSTSVTGLVKGNGTALSAAVAGTDYVTPTGTETLSNKSITQRVVAATTNTTPVVTDSATTDIATLIYTSSGTIVFSAPSGSPVNGQKLMFRIQTTSANTLTWNAVFVGSTTLPLPTTSTGSSKYDYLGFIYNSAANAGAGQWQLIGSSYGY